jgi:hypothetical protein
MLKPSFGDGVFSEMSFSFPVDFGDFGDLAFSVISFLGDFAFRGLRSAAVGKGREREELGVASVGEEIE